MKRNPTAAGRMAPPSGMHRGAPATLTPREAIGMLRRHAWLILFMTVLGGMTGAGGWYLFRRYLPLYQAGAVLKVLPPVDSDPMNIVAIQVQQDLQYGHRVSLASLMKSQSSLQELIRNSDKVRATTWFRETMQGDPVRAFQCLQKHLNAYPHRDAEHIVISMTCARPSEAALIVNEMSRLFVSDRGQREKQDILAKLADVTARQKEVEDNITENENALDGIREKTEMTDLEVAQGRYFQHTITLRLNELDSQESELNLAIKQLRTGIENLEHLAQGPIAEQIEHLVENDPIMVSLGQQLAVLQAQQSGRLTKFGEEHREVRQTKKLIDEIEAKRNQRRAAIAEQTRRANLLNARDSLTIYEKQLAELQKMRSDALAKQKALDDARAQYDRVVKVRDERLEALKQIKMQAEKLRIMSEDPETPKIQIVSLAPDPLEMVLSRHYLLWLPGGTILGFILGLALALLVEMLNDLLRTPSDVRRYLGAPLLGIIPDADEDRAVDDIDLCHVVCQAPYSLLGECYRRCRTNLELSTQEGFKSLLVASGQAGDGKSPVACNLAAGFVAKFEKVLLIDGNLRQPSLHVSFPRGTAEPDSDERRLGLTNFLMGESAPQDIVQPSGMAGLDLIYAGPPAANPAELLASHRMRELVEAVVKDYDRVIIDSPPVLLISDVKILARLVDATLVVLNAATTRRGAAQRTLLELQEVGANIAGCVLFGATAMKGGYFRQQFKAYRRYLKAQLAANSA